MKPATLRRSVLIVDDEEHIREIAAAALRSVAEKVFAVESAEAALDVLREENIDVVITDIRMPGLDGLEFLHRVKQEQPGVRFLMITAHGTLDTVVQALRFGASDFLTKPFENEELRQITLRLLHESDVQPANALPPAPDGRGFHALIGQSAPFLACLDKARKAAFGDATVLILGESGTGKEGLARALHEASPRNGHPFVPVNCGAIPEALIESELFGHEKGAFTGAMTAKPGKFLLSDGGTMFLDEIGELPAAVQVKLLRVLQEHTVDPVGGRESVRVDFRLVAATHRNLREDVRQGRFREDLYFRLNVIPIELPPLRDRGEDILVLARYFLEQFNQRYSCRHRLGAEHEQLLRGYAWPGNVRELANAVERAVVLASGADLCFELEPAETEKPAAKTSMRARRQGVERDEISKALELNRWNKTQAAEYLGISRRGLLYKIKEYGIQ